MTMMSVSEGFVKDIAMATASDMAMASPRALWALPAWWEWSMRPAEQKTK